MHSTTAQRTTWQLARLAEVTDPDEHDGRGFSEDQVVTPRAGSAGAQFLRVIEDSCIEQIEYGFEDRSDAAHEIADGAVPVYTHQLWSTFVDLAAYDEDVSEFGGERGDFDMKKQASLALYVIGARLADALLEEFSNQDDDDQEGR